jgi:hypothetical protein
MRSLSKEAEQKLIGAIEKAATLVNEGATPTDAIIKSAREHDIPSGHINLMVHAYNTGRTTTQREKGESTLEKAAEFPLADVKDVLNALYPETVKSSSEIKRAEAVSTEYALPVAGMLARRRGEMQKAAAAQVALPEKTWTPPPRDAHAAVMRAQSEKVAAQRAEEEKRRQASAAYSKAAAAMDEINIYFRTPGNMLFGDAVREVGLRFGDPGVSVLQKVAAVYPHFTKQADSKKAHFGADPVYELVQNVLDAVGAYNSAQGAVVTKKSEAVSKKTAPEFLTGSILTAIQEAPLTLKAAERKGGPGTNPLGDRAKNTNKQPPKDKTPHIPSLKSTPKREEPEPAPGPAPSANIDPRTAVDGPDDWDVGPTPELDAALEEISFGEQLDRNRADAAARNQEYARQKMLDEASEYERAEKEKLQDALFNESETKRVQQERDEAYARKLRDEDLADDAAAAEQLKAEQAQAAETKKQRQETWSKGKDIGKNFGEGVSKTIKDTVGEPLTGPAKFIGQLLGAKDLSALSPIKDKDPKSMLREQYQQLTDPSHENALKTIRAKSIVHDMVLNDPVISGYDPQDVAMAFNEIAELAPSLIDAPGMIRPLLRKRLESGQLADFDVKQILEMDKLRADRDKTLMDVKDKTLNLL